MDEARENRQNVDDLPAIRADESGMALLRAAGANDVHSVRQLLEKGTNPNMYEKYGRKTPLILAAEFGCFANHALNTPFSGMALLRAAGANDVHSVRQLLEKGVCNNIHPFSFDYLIVALNITPQALKPDYGAFSKVDLVKLLLERGSPVADRSAELNAALREAVLFGRVELVQILLNHGADANHSDDTNSPVIFLSIDSNNVRANPKVRRKVDRKTALSLARSQDTRRFAR
uniref:Ankyrin domain repeat containing protein n=1 Tax=Echinococcus granulosus TaxID=6210 RepID=A0A068WWD9_ECHGR|nr:ankyrin domain repeat containing protein [Echinococcus granulosus]